MDRPAIESRWKRILPYLSRPAPTPTQPPVQRVSYSSRDADHPPLLAPRLRVGWSCISASWLGLPRHVFGWLYLSQQEEVQDMKSAYRLRGCLQLNFWTSWPVFAKLHTSGLPLQHIQNPKFCFPTNSNPNITEGTTWWILRRPFWVLFRQSELPSKNTTQLLMLECKLVADLGRLSY